MKKLFSIFLTLICLLVIIGCGSKNYDLSVEIIEKVYVGEKSNYVVKLMPDDVVIDDYEYSSSSESILKVYNGYVEGVESGKAKLIITKTYEKQNLRIELEVEVLEKEIQYELEVTYDEELEIGESTEIKLKEKQTNTEITDFALFTKNTDVVSYEDNIIIALKEGEANFKVTCTFNDKIITTDFKINVNSQAIEITTNIPNSLYVNQEVDIVVSTIDGKIMDDYSLDIDENLLYFDEDNKRLYVLDEGKTSITISVVINGKKWEVVQEINILEGFSLEVEGDNVIFVGDETTYVVHINPDMVEVTDYRVYITNSSVAKYEDGKLIGLKNGKTRVIFSCTYKEIEVSSAIELEVKRYVNEYLAINIPNYMFMDEESELLVTLEPYKKELKDVVITIADENILQYADGTIKALQEGESNVTVSGTYQGSSYTNTFTIHVYAFSGIELYLPEQMYVNEVKEYYVKALPSEVYMTTFEISASDNVSTNEKYLFSTNEGIANITVSYTYKGKVYEDAKSTNVEKIVYEVERIFLSGSNGLLKGTQNKLEVTTYPKVSEFNIIYESSDETIATVDAEGNVTGVNEGNCVITAYLETNTQVKSIFNLTVLGAKEMSVVSGTNGKGEYLGRYYEQSVIGYYELKNGITETTYYGYTSTMTEGIDVDGYTGLDEIIEVNKFYPQSVHVLEVPSSQNIKIVPYANLNNNEWALTTVKGFIQNYEDKHPNQKVICAINGDFFDINASGNMPYQTTGENITDGEYYKTTNSHGTTGGTLGFTNDGSTVSIVGSGKAERTANMILAIYDENNQIIKEFEVENLNTEPASGESSVYFGIYNDNKEYVSVTVSSDKKMYVVERAELALPNSSTDFYGLGTITSTSSTTIEKGSFAIVSDNEEINEVLQIGTRIRIQYEFTGEYANVTSATGYNNLIYDNIDLLPDSYIADRAPRTVVGMKADGTIVMMVIDGRQGADDMYGADGTELAAIMKAYGCICAYNLDGGGSSTIVVRDESGLVVLNSPSDGRERSDGNCILVVCEDPNYTVEVNELTDSKVTLAVSNINENYKPYICLNNEYYEVKNGKVTIDNLVHNTKYNYKVYYKDGETLYETMTVGTFTTKKSNFKFLGVTIWEEEDTYIVKVYYDDVDSSSSIDSMAINFNGIETYLNKGEITLNKTIVGDYIETFEYSYWYEDGLNKITIEDNVYFLW